MAGKLGYEGVRFFHPHLMGTDRQRRTGFDLPCMDVVWSLSQGIDVWITGFTRIHTGEDVSVPIDHLGSEVQGGTVSTVPVDNHQLGYPLASCTHTYFVHQLGQGVGADADGAGKILMVIGNPVGNQW